MIIVNYQGDTKDLPPAIQDKWNAVFSGVKMHKDSEGDNSVFDEFQQHNMIASAR